MDAAISAPKPPVIGASWLTCYDILSERFNLLNVWQVRQINYSKKLRTRSFPVFFTDASTVSLSHGISVLRSMSSQDTPSCQIVGLEMINHENEEEATWGKKHHLQ
jgi:hypothetical protein